MATPKTSKNLFPQTRWSIIASTDDAHSLIRKKAFENLCQVYWPPLYGFARMKGKSIEDSEDLLQGFFLKICSNKTIKNAEESHGKFRTYLLKGFENFMLDDWRKSQAQRRGGNEAIVISIDGEAGEKTLDLPDGMTPTPEEMFDRNWAKVLLNQTLVRLRDKFEAKEKIGDYEAMLPFLSTSDEPNYQATAEALGRTVESTRVYVQRFRAAYQQCIRAELADTLEQGADVEEELRGLLGAFSKD